MTQEEKDLLFRDLSARLPYHVRVKIWIDYGTEEGILDLEHNYADVLLHAFYYNKIKKIKPYLRSMSSITEEEKKEILEKVDPLLENSLSNTYDKNGEIKNDIFSLNRLWEPVFIEELTKRHFDYRGLIEKGLAIEAPKDMYK